MLSAAVLSTAAGGSASAAEPALAGPPVPAAMRIVAAAVVTKEGDCVKPYVLARPKGGAYLLWARRDGERSAAFFARSTDGTAFDAPVRLSPKGMDVDLGAESG